MPTFGRAGGKQNHRSHSLEPAPGAGPVGASAANSQEASASSNSDPASSFSFAPPPPPPHTLPVFASGPPPTSTNPPFGYDSRSQPPLDFAEQVSRSQSTRYPGPQGAPLAPQHHYGPASTSADDLSTTLPNTTTLPLNSPSIQQQQQPIVPQQPAPAPEARRSTRKLIKNILSGSTRDPHPPPTTNSYDNREGLARRPSKRISQQPPAIRTGGVSQVSLEQQNLDWPPPLGQLTQPSPLQGVGEFAENYTVPESNREVLLQDPHGLQQPTLRRVPTDHEPPYGPDDIGAARQPYLQLQGQGSPEQQQNPYGQGQYDLSPQNPQQQYPGQSQQVLTGHLNTNLPSHQNPDTVSQLSHDSPVTDPDQLNLSTQTSPAVTYPLQSQSQTLSDPAQSPIPAQQQQQSMPPPAGQPSTRRSQEAEKTLRNAQVEPPPGPPPGYRHSQAPNMNPLPPPPPGSGGPTPANYRQSAVPDRQFEGAQEGRNSPQPGSDRDANQDPDKALKELVVKYKNVKRLYFDGKNQIDLLTGQVEQLQNAIANQRMSQSRTSLDDSEYTTRFNRLNGAINNLSFNIRKDWVTLPSWLHGYVSSDALKTGKQEMTAVGRAVISRWVVDEIFNHCFHPGLDADLSRQLKEIERNIRKFSYKMHSQEEYDALTSKVVAWRMATLEGLQAVLNSSDSSQHRGDFTQRAATNLTASLYQHLANPPPPGVDGSASMIVELAVGIAFHMPMESRDVAITYPMPLEPVNPHLMDVEKTGLPALETRPSNAGEDEDEEETKAEAKGKDALPPKDAGKIRFAGFMVVDVRGRQVLVKAPVWTIC